MLMDGGSVLTIILWILAINAILILSVWGLVAWWRKQARAAIHSISIRIQGFADQMDQLAGFLRAYHGIDQEPFYTPLDALQKEASGLEYRVQQFLDTCRAFEEEITAPPSNQLQGIINAPVTWFRRWRKSIGLRRESEELDRQMASTEQRMQGIYELPWELAAECRQASQQVTELLDIIQWLQSEGASGVSFQKVVSQVPIIQQALNSVSPIFLQAPKEELLTRANLASTIHVFETLSTLRPALDRYLPRVHEWQANLEKASQVYAELKQSGANLRQALVETSAGLNIASLQERLDHVAQAAAEANQRLAQPDVDALKPLIREVTQLHKTLQDTQQQFTRAAEMAPGLQRSLEELEKGLESLSAQFSALEHNQKLPILWDESAGLLNDLRQKVQSLGTSAQLRSPEQVLQQSALVETLQASYKGLAKKIPQVAGQYTSLLALLEHVEIQEAAIWLQKSREMLGQAAVYDLKNWPKKDTPQSLLGEMLELEQLQKKLLPADWAAPLNESALPERLEETRQLAAMHKDLRPRVENARAQFDRIRALEEQSKEMLTGAWSTLEKVALLAESNDLLEEIAGSEMDQLGDEIRQMGSELNNHSQGEIEKKAQRIKLQVEKNSQAINQWVARLNTAVVEQAQQISARLAQIDAIIRLDEPVLEDARALLQREEMVSLRSASPPAQPSAAGRIVSRVSRGETKPINDLEALGELKRKNDLWQMLAASNRATEEKCAALLAAHQEVVQARNETRDRLAEIAKNFPEKRTWPPNNQVPLSEKQALHPVDEKWQSLKKKTSRAEWAILELFRLAQQFRLISERAGQLLNRIQQDHERIQELEWQIDAVKQRWSAQIDPGNSILREGIQLLLSQADSKLAYIKQQNLRGVLSYEQAIQNLQLLYDELFTAQVPLDGNNKIGINEPRRRSEKQP